MSSDAVSNQSDLRSPRWLHGAAPDLLFGCGVGYFGIFFILAMMGVQVQKWIPLSVLPLVLLVTSTPHYGATLMRVFGQREGRAKYAAIGIGSTLLMMVAFALSLQYHLLGSILVTIYFNWNPWHYAGQNYGLSLMFLHRRGVVVDPVTKRLLWLSFLLSWVLAFLTNNGTVPGALFASSYGDSISATAGPAFRFLSIGIPEVIQGGAFTLGLCVYLLCLFGAALRLLRVGSFRDLLPSALLVFTQSLWFVIPATAQMEGLFSGLMPLAQENRQYVFMWIIVGHAVQYLWISTYYAKRSSGYSGGFRYFAMCVFVGAILWNLPPFLFAPEFFGSLAYNDGLQLLVATVVNLQHFILDGAIWKLRDGRVASILLRPVLFSKNPKVSPGQSWMRPAVVALGVLSLTIMLVGLIEGEFGFRRPALRGDIGRAEIAIDRLAWVGQGAAWRHRFLGYQKLQAGDYQAAKRYFDESLELKDHADAWSGIGDVHSRLQQWGPAADAYERSYALKSATPQLVLRFAYALIEAGRLDRARELLETASERFPESGLIRDALSRLDVREAG